MQQFVENNSPFSSTRLGHLILPFLLIPQTKAAQILFSMLNYNFLFRRSLFVAVAQMFQGLRCVQNMAQITW